MTTREAQSILSLIDPARCIGCDLAAIGMDLVAISVNEQPDDVSSFLESHPAAFTVALDQHGAMAARYRVTGFPTHVLIDRMGWCARLCMGRWMRPARAGCLG